MFAPTRPIFFAQFRIFFVQVERIGELGAIDAVFERVEDVAVAGVGTEDVKEGMTSFVEKRAPVFNRPPADD